MGVGNPREQAVPAASFPLSGLLGTNERLPASVFGCLLALEKLPPMPFAPSVETLAEDAHPLGREAWRPGGEEPLPLSLGLQGGAPRASCVQARLRGTGVLVSPCPRALLLRGNPPSCQERVDRGAAHHPMLFLPQPCARARSSQDGRGSSAALSTRGPTPGSPAAPTASAWKRGSVSSWTSSSPSTWRHTPKPSALTTPSRYGPAPQARLSLPPNAAAPATAPLRPPVPLSGPPPLCSLPTLLPALGGRDRPPCPVASGCPCSCPYRAGPWQQGLACRAPSTSDSSGPEGVRPFLREDAAPQNRDQEQHRHHRLCH